MLSIAIPDQKKMASAVLPSPMTKKNTIPILGGADFDFNLSTAKIKIFKSLDEKTPPNFRKFYQSSTFDRLVQTILLYFAVMFQHEWVENSMERSRKQRLEGYNPYIVGARIRELAEEQKQLRMEISPIYSEIILKHSSYKNPQQDRLFFESLYESLINIADEGFHRMQKRADIEYEIGQIFRTKHFNLYKRKNQPPRSVDSLTVKELYTVKNETTNRALNAKLLGSLYEKPETLGVTVASVTNSQLITQYIQSPIVARSMMKDPELRKKMFKDMDATEEAREANILRRSSRAPHATDDVEEGSTKEAEAGPNSSGASITGGHPRYGAKSAVGISLPEAAGLPVDETFTFLSILKRYIVHGPQLGMVPGAALNAGWSHGANNSSLGITRMSMMGGRE
jgi:hypothetical protein